MTSKIPLSLKGSNLGERHRHFNKLVTEAYHSDEPIEIILAYPENSPLDRLFKIDLASKHRHLEYILNNLQDEDMLYVSRALKSKWLLEREYNQIIHPHHLEIELYPDMTTTAVSKMKNWIFINLRDPEQCLKFYQYSNISDTDYAIKFLCKCPEEVILREFPKSKCIEKMTPHRLKLLCEKTPICAKLFYEILSEDKSLFKLYMHKEQEYFHSIKCVLKTNSEIFLDIVEKHFLTHFNRLSTVATKYIMMHQKDRFQKKSEFYTARVLNVTAVAQCLTPDECEKLVLKLAQARYLTEEHWFNYKNVEPLIKRIDHTKRASFKNKVFVEKNVGECVLQWPYTLPKVLNILSDFDDYQNFLECKELNNHNIEDQLMRVEMCGGGAALYCPQSLSCRALLKKTTFLDALYEEYRFKNFNKTLFELRKKIKTESSSQNRMNMFLVLISKSGGKTENLDILVSFLMEFKNEPSQVRAAVVRSLVKRTSIWRTSEDNWKNLLIFGRGLGLDGGVPETDCIEGLHAVVIRTLLSYQHCENSIKKAFLNNFSTLMDYSLVTSEKTLIKTMLPKMLVESVETEVDTFEKVKILEYAIDTIQAYNIKFDALPKLTNAVKKLTENNQAATRQLLERLFHSKLGRKELFKENYDIVQTDASYVNALRHDVTILSVDKFLKAIVSNKMTADQFLRKIRVYFNGNDDLASDFLIAIKEAKLHTNLARPLAYLIGNDLKTYMFDLDRNDKEHKQFSASLRANAHVARPFLNIDAMDRKKAGAKLIANKVIICKTFEIDNTIERLLSWKRTARLAIILAQRTNYEPDVFAAVAKIRPTVALKAALTYFRREGEKSNVKIWEIIKPLIVKVKTSPHLVNNFRNVNSIPFCILPEYLEESFKLISKLDFEKSLGILFTIKINLSKMNCSFIEEILIDFVQNKLTLENIPNENYNYAYERVVQLYLSIFGKYLLLCGDEESQKRKLGTVGQMYFDQLKTIWASDKNKKVFFRYLAILSESLRFTEVFLDVNYVSCSPVFENIVNWMRSFIAVEEHFHAYVPLHLNMLYYKTIRETVEIFPGLLDDKEKRKEGYKTVGELFGKYIAEEASVLSKNYFDSIVFLYGIGLLRFFGTFNLGRFQMAPYCIKAIVDASEGIECTLALTLFDNVYHRLSKEDVNQINECLSKKELIEMQFCHRNLRKVV